MSTTKYTDLFNEVLPEVPGCSNPLAESAIKNAVIAFCRDSWVWGYTPDAQNVELGVAEYPLEAPAGADVAEVQVLSIEGVPLDPLTADDIAAERAGFTVNDDHTSVTIYPTPTENITGGLTFYLTLAPRRASTSFPAWLFSKFSDGLTAGAKARLMRIPSKPWTDMKLGAHYLNEFRIEVAAAKEESLRKFGRAVIRTTSQH